jgi:deoxyribonuclease-1
MTNRGLAVASLVLLSTVTHNTFAGGQTKFNDPKKVEKQTFWNDLYPEASTTFFCNQPFKHKSRRVSIGRIYNNQMMLDHFNCGTKSACRRNSPEYQHAASDLHNLYPVSPRVELNRRNARYSELPNISDQFPNLNCSYKSVQQEVEPADEIKGNIARIIFYMHDAYNLPIYGSVNNLLDWNERDPVDEAEKQRNDLVEEIQGNRNRFVDNPHAIKDLKLQ